MLAARDPLLADTRTVRALAGWSGAGVFLATRDGRHWFVRKAAANPAGSARLRGQIAKQRAFADLLHGLVSTPRIVDEGEVDGRYFVDMDFVRGVDAASHLRRAAYADVDRFTGRLTEYLATVSTLPATAQRNSADSEGGVQDPMSPRRGRAASPAGIADSPPNPSENYISAAGSLFDAAYDKVCDVQRRSGAIPEADLAKLFLALGRLRGLREATMCHGDLTLENMLVDEGGRIWLLDFLDAPFEHWWQDVAKLHQDLSGGWYLLGSAPVDPGSCARAVLAASNGPASLSRERVVIAPCVRDFVSRRLIAAAVKLDPAYASVHALLVALAFVRIVPYTRTSDDLRFVLERVSHFARLAGQD